MWRWEFTVLRGRAAIAQFCRIDRLGLSISAAMIFLAFGSVIAGEPAIAQLTAASCATNDEIPADKREALEHVALGFVQALISFNAEAAYAALSPEAKQTLSRDTLATLIAAGIRPMAPFSDVHAAQIHLVKVATSAPNARALCGSLASPEGWVSVAVKPIAEQAHILIAAQTRNNGWAFTLWLMPEPDWRVAYFQLTASSLVGKTAHDMWDLARSEQQARHDFNAAILYRAANQLAYRGPNFQLGISSEIQKEMQKMQLPPELQGQAPFIWKSSGDEYRVLDIGPIGVGGEIYLMITQEIEPWGADQEADQHNRALIADFKRAVPEYSSVFAGLLVGAKESGGNRFFRTVDDAATAPK
jgi:hypothetical protein